MVKTNDIMTAINEKIVESFPYTVYVQRCPKDFVRPSFWIQHIRTSRRDVNRSTVEKTVYFTITCFTPLDEHFAVDPEELIELQEAIIQLFSAGYLNVGDRAIKIKSSSGGIDIDRAYVDLQFEFYDDRFDETDDAETAPIMGDISLNLKEG